MSINRTFDPHADNHQSNCRDRNTELYYYVDEETSELIKEYYFARDSTLTLGNRDQIQALGIQFKFDIQSLVPILSECFFFKFFCFSDLVRGILGQLNDELNEATETYYQTFVTDTNNSSSFIEDTYSAE